MVICAGRLKRICETEIQKKVKEECKTNFETDYYEEF